MKKQPLFLITIVLFFLFTISLVSPLKINAQEEIIEPSTTPTSTPQDSTSSAIVKYDLAFPGMLPDSPFYKLKVLRDKISEGMISDPNKKINFYLLQADKGILASAILVDKNKVDLAITTSLKAEDNYTKLAREVRNMFPTKIDKNVYEKLKTAGLKHQEVLNEIIKKVSKDKQKDFANIIYFSQSNMKTLEEFQTKKELEE